MDADWKDEEPFVIDEFLQNFLNVKQTTLLTQFRSLNTIIKPIIFPSNLL